MEFGTGADELGRFEFSRFPVSDLVPAKPVKSNVPMAAGDAKNASPTAIGHGGVGVPLFLSGIPAPVQNGFDDDQRRDEAAANTIAESLYPGSMPGVPSGETGESTVGADDMHTLEQRTGLASDQIRIHRDDAANREATGLGALAFARGRDISFARRAPPFASSAGKWLLAHEMAHVAQQDGSQPRVQLFPDRHGGVRDPGGGVVSDVPGAVPGDAMDPTSGVEVDEAVRVVAPVLDQQSRGRDRDQTYHLHSAIISQIPISAYAIPRSRLTLNVEGTIPATGAPTITPGATVYGPTHLPHAVLSADAANVIVESSATIHYAVGAGSCVLVRTNGGWYLFDAGININESHAMAEAIAGKIHTRLAGEPVRAIFLTHAHYDHISLISRLAGRVQIDAIVANPLQFARQEYVDIRDSIRQADLTRRAAERSRIEADTHAREAFVESLERSGSADAIGAEDVQQRWREEVARRVEAMYPELTESVSLPVQGRNGLEFETVGTRPIHGGPQRSVAVEDLLPSREGTELRGVVDPDFHGKETMRPGEVDRMSTTYVLTIAGSRRIIMPDLRRTDVNRLKQELTRALGGQSVEFQEWVYGHHMQHGWHEGVVSAQTMRETLQLLHDFRAGGSGGHPGRDVMIASVDPIKVDARQIRLLRLLGFETYLAQSQADVHTYEVLAGGRAIRGVRAPLAPDAHGEPTLRRSMAARRSLDNDMARLVERRSQATTSQEHGEVQTQIQELNGRITRITSLELTLIETAKARTFDAAAMEQAEIALNQALDAAGVGRVVTSSSQLTDTALVLLREPLGPEPEAGTPQAEQRVRNLALREQKQRVDLLRERARGISGEGRQGAYADLYAEMAQYEHLLTAESERAGAGVTRDVAEAELTRIRSDRTSLEGSFRTGEPTRLPDGQLVETRLVRVQAPAGEAAGGPAAPSRTAQVMLQGLGYLGRGLGGLMVISTIRGSSALIDRYERGQANLTELGIGGIRQATSGVVGVRMLRGARVGTGVFILIAALEVGEAYAGDYDSGTERRHAINASVRNAAISTGCMIAGEMLIATANPFGIIAGAIVMLAGPLIINFLFGNEPEDLFPDEVTNVDKRLVELLREYRTVIGGLSLVRRSPGERQEIGLNENIESQSESSVMRHRMRALYLESQILPRFEAAYAEAGQGRSGLRELDVMRANFLEMRARASTDESDEEARTELNRLSSGMGGSTGDRTIAPTGFNLPVEHDAQGRPISIRQRTLERFRAMERGLDLNQLTVQQINEMDQWRSIRDATADLIREAAPIDPDWRDLRQRQHDLEARLTSARYRLDPEAQYGRGQAARHQPLLSPGTPARAAYEVKLAEAERFVYVAEMMLLRSHVVNLRHEGVDTSGIEGLWNNAQFASPSERRFAVANDALVLYERTTAEIGGPPAAVGGVEALYREPSAQTIYLTQLETNRPYRKLLRRLEVNEIAADSVLGSLGREVYTGQVGTVCEPGPAAPIGRVNALQERFRQLKNDRKVRRGILFAQEVEEIRQQGRRRAIDYFSARLVGGRLEHPLSGEEESALRSGDYGRSGRRLLDERRTIVERLERIPNLRVPVGPTEITDASGTTMRVSRSIGGIMRLDGLTSNERMLVGVTDGQAPPGMVSVIALNDAAAQALGGFAQNPVISARLTQATENDL